MPLHSSNTRYNGGRWDWNLRDAAHFQRGLFNMVGSQLPVLLGASGLLMVLVCINIASLLGQHAARRRREVAIRSALGATPARIAAQVLAQTGLLALGGALAGWAASIGMARGLYVLLPNFGVPLAFNLHSDTRILLFVTAVAVAVTLACGIYPVRQSLRVSQNEALHEGGAAVAGSSRNRFGRRMLLGLQLGICFVVLVCCGLLTRTALNIANRTTGFDPANCLTASVALSRSGYTEQRGLAFQAALLDRMRSAPGVASATLTSHLPMGDDGVRQYAGLQHSRLRPCQRRRHASRSPTPRVLTFSASWASPCGQGREFDTHDNATSTAVAVINESMAHRYWPKGDAIGNNVIVDQRPRRIVGIVRDYAYSDPANTDPEPVLFLPLAQNYSSDVIVALRSRTTASAVTAQLRQAVAGLDSSLAAGKCAHPGTSNRRAISNFSYSRRIAQRLRHLQRARRHAWPLCSHGLLRHRAPSRIRAAHRPRVHTRGCLPAGIERQCMDGSCGPDNRRPGFHCRGSSAAFHALRGYALRSHQLLRSRCPLVDHCIHFRRVAGPSRRIGRTHAGASY